jgi:energy-coupling factor transport system ATP-binding protein
MSIEVENISYTYLPDTIWEKKALQDISFGINQGEILGIIGAIGSGKSTLLQILNGLLLPDCGRVVIDNVDLSGLKRNALARLRRKVGWVSQIPEKQLFAATVYNDIAFGPRNMGCCREDLDNRVKEAMKNVGLRFDDYKDRSPFELSGGQKRRVAIAGILSMQPDYLLLDEPTAGLDWEGRRDLLQHLQELAAARGTGIVLVSHREEDIIMVCDRLLVLDNGKVQAYGPTLAVMEVLENHSHPAGGLTPSRQLLKQLQTRGCRVNTSVKGPEEAAQEIDRFISTKN